MAKDNLWTGFASAYFLPVGSKVTMQILETPAGVTGCWFPRLMNSCSAKLLLTKGVQDYGQVAGAPGILQIVFVNS